jgi:ABC-type phosphate transport system substrate-binding protein
MRMSRYVVALGLALAASAANAQEGGFKLVVNASNAVSSLTTDEAAQYFLKKKTAWPGGRTVQPVDQAAESPVRRAFSKAVLKKDVGAVKSYWQTQIFSGRGVPPPEKSSDAAVLAFVEANSGAIGYVSADANVGRGVKEVKLD